MKKFRINPLDNKAMLQWLWENLGPGSYWEYKWMSTNIHPENGDKWGYCHIRGDELFILDDNRAVLFALRWL